MNEAEKESKNGQVEALVHSHGNWTSEAVIKNDDHLYEMFGMVSEVDYNEKFSDPDKNQSDKAGEAYGIKKSYLLTASKQRRVYKLKYRKNTQFVIKWWQREKVNNKYDYLDYIVYEEVGPIGLTVIRSEVNKYRKPENIKKR